MHELRTDLQVYTKEDMQNNKFIFQEQQKIALKLSLALDFTMEEFDESLPFPNRLCPDAILPRPDQIYSKKFHFLEDTLDNWEY